MANDSTINMSYSVPLSDLRCGLCVD